jgi:hypothetical protein
MTTALQRLLAAIGLALVSGLLLHMIGSPQGDRITAIALAALVAIPVVNVLIVLGQEIGRRHWGFVAATAAILAEIAFVLWR